MPKKYNPATSIRDVSILTKEAILGTVDVVEHMHYNISRLGLVKNFDQPKRTTGITGLVYRIIRKSTATIGDLAEYLLSKIDHTVKDKESSSKREAMISALNGVIGDQLAQNRSSLAISMRILLKGKPITTHSSITDELEKHKKKVVLLIHGACMNDQQWLRKGHNHGDAIGRELGYLPLFLQYNSGLHISENGKHLSDELEKFFCGTLDIELVIIGHSMGGLVTRSAINYAQKTQQNWSQYVKKIIFLGTPHHGAPLERGGNWFETTLSKSAFSAPLSRLGKIRSHGITDLRYGYLTDEDWKGRDPFHPVRDQRVAIPLPKDISCYTVAATMSKKEQWLLNHITGDGLVPVRSALGLHDNSKYQLDFRPSHQYISHQTGHLDLLNHEKIYEQIKKWIQT